ncbi:hypothetical protein PMAYCL1PPCAC_17553, partial [Pristionchus mayeri]
FTIFELLSILLAFFRWVIVRRLFVDLFLRFPLLRGPDCFARAFRLPCSFAYGLSSDDPSDFELTSSLLTMSGRAVS